MRPLTQHVAAHAARKHVAAALGMHTRGHKAAAAPRRAFFGYSEGALKVLRMYSELTPTVLRDGTQRGYSDGNAHRCPSVRATSMRSTSWSSPATCDESFWGRFQPPLPSLAWPTDCS